MTFLKFHEYTKVNEGLSLDHKDPGKKKVNFMIGRFQPPTLGHIKVFEELHKKNGLPVMIMLVRAKKKNPDKIPFEDSLIEKMFDDIMKSYKYIEGYRTITTAGIDTIFNQLRPKYEGVLWGSGTDRVKSYDTQIQRYRKELNAGDDLAIYEIKRGDEDISASKVREALKDNDEKVFNKLEPKSLHKYFKQLQKQIK